MAAQMLLGLGEKPAIQSSGGDGGCRLHIRLGAAAKSNKQLIHSFFFHYSFPSPLYNCIHSKAQHFLFFIPKFSSLYSFPFIDPTLPSTSRWPRPVNLLFCLPCQGRLSASPTPPSVPRCASCARLCCFLPSLLCSSNAFQSLLIAISLLSKM